jgi:protoheme IX farnesyltransferase
VLNPHVQLAPDYPTLAIPRLQTLLLFTTAGSMLAAGQPSLALVRATCLGGALTAGGSGRPEPLVRAGSRRAHGAHGDPTLPAGRIWPSAALVYGCVLGAGGVGLLWVGLNPLAATLSLAGLVLYVLVLVVHGRRSGGRLSA